MLMKRSDLYNYIKSTCKGEYSIGIHGVAAPRMTELANMDLQSGIDRIMNNGLNVFGARTINGTVHFMGRIDYPEKQAKMEKELTNYKYWIEEDYIIVALPTILRSEDGREIFLGATNLESKYKSIMGTTGCETSTIMDDVILDDFVVKPEYILGRFRVVGKDLIEYYPNERHISHRGGKIDNSYYDEIIKKIKWLAYSYNLDLSILEDIDSNNDEKIQEIITSLENIIKQKKDLFFGSCSEAFVCETLQQLLVEKEKRRKKTNSIDEETSPSDFEIKPEGNNNDEDGQIIVTLNKGNFRSLSDVYYINFSYPNKYQAHHMMDVFQELLKLYGQMSPTADPSKWLFPYLIDENGEFTSSFNPYGVGGTNVPESLLRGFLSRFIEVEHCVVKCGEYTMSDRFSQETYDAMITSLNSKTRQHM